MPFYYTLKLAFMYTIYMHKRGFTLIELMIAVTIIAILATLAIMGYGQSKEKAKLARVSTELSDIATSVTQYAQDNDFQYPPDTDRSLPPGLEPYLAGGVWPTSVYPHGVFDWDNWLDSDSNRIYQITYRLCDFGDPISSCRDPILFPTFTRNSGIYYCIQGNCIPHRDDPTAPAYCVNCKVKKINY